MERIPFDDILKQRNLTREDLPLKLNKDLAKYDKAKADNNEELMEVTYEVAYENLMIYIGDEEKPKPQPKKEVKVEPKVEPIKEEPKKVEVKEDEPKPVTPPVVETPPQPVETPKPQPRPQPKRQKSWLEGLADFIKGKE